MKCMLTALYARHLASYLIAALIAVSAFAAPAEAMLLATGPPASAPIDRAADLALIQRALEAQVLQAGGRRSIDLEVVLVILLLLLLILIIVEITPADQGYAV